MEGYDGPITLVGDEPCLPYQRPPLSKGCLTGQHDLDAIDLRPESFYEHHDIELRMGRRIEAIDLARRLVLLAAGGEIDYGHLVLATGCRNRLLPVPGGCYLRTRDEAAALLDRLATAARIVVIGGGFIGLEVAAAASAIGKSVVVVEPQARLMQRAVGPIVSDFYLKLHRQHGAHIALGVAPIEIVPETGVRLNNGEFLKADLVVVGIGVIPCTELAAAAGLEVANGIVVDEYLRTSDERVFAIGDCAAYPNRFAGARVRLESVQNAVDHARCVAATICGKPAPYDTVPWFWTDQFDSKLQMCGLSQGFDTQVLRGDIEIGKFSVCYFHQGRLLAIDSLNRPGDHITGRKLLAAGISPTLDEAADPQFDWKSLVT